MTHQSTNEQTTALAEDYHAAEENYRKEYGERSTALLTHFVGELDTGPIRARAKKKGEQAPDFTLINASGSEVNLYTELKKGPVILTWYRGGWCPYCNLALAYLQQHLPEFRAAGASLIAITPERPDKSLTTRERHALDFEILTDEDNVAARIYGVVHQFNEEVKEYYKQARFLGHYSKEQQEFPVPATYIIDTDATILYASIAPDYQQRLKAPFIVGIIRQQHHQNHE